MHFSSPIYGYYVLRSMDELVILLTIFHFLCLLTMYYKFLESFILYYAISIIIIIIFIHWYEFSWHDFKQNSINQSSIQTIEMFKNIIHNICMCIQFMFKPKIKIQNYCFCYIRVFYKLFNMQLQHNTLCIEYR